MKNSDLVLPIRLVAHLAIINGLIYYFNPEVFQSGFHMFYLNASWLVFAYTLQFYILKRNERFFDGFGKTIKLYFFFGLAYLAPFGFQGINNVSWQFLIGAYLVISLSLIIFRWVFYKIRRSYRMEGGNSASVVVIGWDQNLKKIRTFFDDPYLGYRYKGFFAEKPSKSKTYLGKITDCFIYVLENDIDEIYCIASELTTKELQLLIDFADNNLIKIKVIPDNKDVFSRAMSIDLYDSVPVINLRTMPLDTEYARILKRLFDLLFSTLVIVLLLSWLIPVLFIIIRCESKGPLFFKQKRHGYKRKSFWCYKFRSMAVNKDADSKMAVKYDMRITKVGRLLRKTNLDELPQFFNVFLGNMSVVGPRPHMVSHTDSYQNSVDKYLVRHFVKPGITGLAQTRGYRGEIRTSSDIRNRIRLDIFYVERWSIFMDIKIIYMTVINALMGEEKAY